MLAELLDLRAMLAYNVYARRIIMEISKIYDMIEKSFLSGWLEEIEKEENNVFKKDVDESRRELYAQLNEEQKKLAVSLERVLELYWEYVYYNINIRVLNVGIETGMQLQQAFAKQE